MKNITCIEDLRGLARRRVPKAFFDYAEAGSYSEQTLRANREDLQRIKLHQRVLIDVSARTTATTLLGEPVPLPLALSTVVIIIKYVVQVLQSAHQYFETRKKFHQQ